MHLLPGAVAAVHRLHCTICCASSRSSPLSVCSCRPRSCWVDDCGDGGGALRHCGLAGGESEESCGLSESDVFSLGLTGLPGPAAAAAAAAVAAAAAQPWSAFALGAQAEAWPAGGQVRLGSKALGATAEEPSLLEEALTSCGLASLYPQLSERSASASITATGAPCGLAGACGSLGPFGSLATDAPGHLPIQVELRFCASCSTTCRRARARVPLSGLLLCGFEWLGSCGLAGSRHGGSVRLLLAWLAWFL